MERVHHDRVGILDAAHEILLLARAEGLDAGHAVQHLPLRGQVVLDQVRATGTPWASRARPAEIVVETVQAIGGNNRFEGEALGILLVILALLGAVGARRGEVVELRAEPGPLITPTLVAGGVLGLGAAVALVTGGAFEARYAAVVVPVLVVLVARGISLLPGRVGPAMLALVVVGGLAIGLDEARRDRTQAADVAAVIDADHRPGDVVAFCPDQVGPSTRRALDADLATLAYPRGTGDLVDWRDYAEVVDATPAAAFVDRVLGAAGEGDIWLVASTGYRSLDSRCEEIIALLGGARVADQRVAPAETFERMLLTRYTVAP